MNENLEKALIPKHNPIIEARLLGALMHVGNSQHLIAQEIMSSVTETCFYNPGYRELFLFIKSLYENDTLFDATTLIATAKDELHNTLCNVIGEGYTSATTYRDDIAKLNLLKNIRPMMQTLVTTLGNCANINVPEQCIEEIQRGVQQISDLNQGSANRYCETYQEIIEQILESPESQETEIQTDLETWPPFPADAMITIAGRSGTGKTFIAIFLMEKIICAKRDQQGLYFNLEMQKQQMLNRHAGILKKSSGNVQQNVENALPELMERDVKLITKPGITIEEIEVIARSQALQKKISVIVIDYIGLVRSSKRFDQKHLEQSEIAQRLAGLAIELNCVVLTLLQVNREHKNRPAGDKAPMTTDAADSMGCERSSSWWLGIDQPQVDTDDPQWRDIFIIKNRKNRGKGGYFTIYMKFKDATFEEINQNIARADLVPKKPIKEKYGYK